MPTDKELITDWGARCRRGKAFRQRIYPDASWDRFEGYFRNRYPGLSQDEYAVERRVPLGVQTDGIIATEARKMVPKVTFGIPYVRVRPLAGRTVTDAKVLERVINGILEQIAIGNTLDITALSTIQHGTSFIKMGYDSEYAPSYKDIFQVGFSDGAFDKKGKRKEYRDHIFPGMPWATWQHPKAIIFPEMLTGFDQARWVAFQYLRPTEDLKADKRLRNTAELKPKPQRLADLDSSLARDNLEYEYVQDMTLCTEIRDKASGQMLILAEGHDKILYKEDDVLMGILGGRLPIHALTFNRNTDYAWGTSDVHMVEEELKELMDIRTQTTLDRRLRVLKFLYRKGAISSTEMQRLVSGKGGAGVEIDGDLERSIKAFTMPSQHDITREADNASGRIKEHFGTNAFAVLPSSRRTSGEVSGAQQDSGVAVSRAQGLVQELVLKLAKDIAAMVFNFWTEETVVDILGPVTEPTQLPDGSMQEIDVTKQIWVKFKGNELRGNFDYTLQPSSGRLVDHQQQKREALELVQFFSQVPGVNHQELLRQVAGVFDTIDVDKIFTPLNSTQDPLGISQLAQLTGDQQGLNRKSPREV